MVLVRRLLVAGFVIFSLSMNVKAVSSELTRKFCVSSFLHGMANSFVHLGSVVAAGSAEAKQQAACGLVGSLLQMAGDMKQASDRAKQQKADNAVSAELAAKMAEVQKLIQAEQDAAKRRSPITENVVRLAGIMSELNHVICVRGQAYFPKATQGVVAALKATRSGGDNQKMIALLQKKDSARSVLKQFFNILRFEIAHEVPIIVRAHREGVEQLTSVASLGGDLGNLLLASLSTEELEAMLNGQIALIMDMLEELFIQLMSDDAAEVVQEEAAATVETDLLSQKL